MGVLKIVPNNGGSVTLTSVLDSARAAITLYSDAARSTAVTLPATVSGSTRLYPPVAYAGQLWLKATAPGGVVVTGSGATALPEYDVVRVHLLDADVTEAPVSARDNAGFAAGELSVRSVDGAAGDVDLSGTYAPAAHSHAASSITSGVLPIARLATGTPDGTKFVRDDGTLATPPGGGSDAALNRIVVPLSAPFGGGAPGTWLSANRYVLTRFTLDSPMVVHRALLCCAVAAGNVQSTIMSLTKTSATQWSAAQVCTTGIIACPTPVNQGIALPYTTNPTLPKGEYLVSFWCDNATATFIRTLNTPYGALGCTLRDSNYSDAAGVPTTKTLDTYDGAFVGIAVEGGTPLV